MPRVKIAYVVSFSSEDPEHRAANLLATEVSKKKWLCGAWEPSCSVLLQLERAVEISAVHIGAHHAALIEVLGGLSERPNDPFQVVVPSCVFVPAAQSRRERGVARVRSFSGAQLADAARARTFDRLRVVCSQPYNKHCKYGLSFVHVHSAEPRPSAALPARLRGAEPASSDEDEFRPGELFAAHLQSPANDVNIGNTNTSVQIRQATSQALKNISDSSSKLLKAAITKAECGRAGRAPAGPADRRRPGLLYTADDERPHDRIDRVLDRHNYEKTKDEQQAGSGNKKGDKEKTSEGSENCKRNNEGSQNSTNKDAPLKPITARDPTRAETQKRGRHSEQGAAESAGEAAREAAGPECAELAQVLRGVTLVLSGYEGARRAALRDLALRLGARYSALWGPHCTHLVCAFPNTPKLRAVRGEARGAGVATAAWLEACAARRRRLPWQWFATLPADRLPEPPPPHEPPRRQSAEKRAFSEDEDTDDEIEKALSGNKRARPAPGEGAADASGDSDVAFVCDERVRGHVTLDSDDEATDAERPLAADERIDAAKALPDFFEGYTFVISEELRAGPAARLARYVRAYGGLLLQASQAQDSEVHYVVTRRAGAQAGAGRGEPVSPAWVWRCHRARRLCSPRVYRATHS